MKDNSETPEFTRPVRSYVRRQGRLTTAQARALAVLWPTYGIDFRPRPMDLAELFGNAAPVTLEVGFGNGDNLLDMATQRPAENFLGIEVHEPGVGHCMLGIEQRNLRNVRVIRHDAIEVLRDMLADGSLHRVNLFFPDPWPKKRHHKRRIVQPAFVELVYRVLVPGGLFHVATDWPDYAEHIAAVMSDFEAFEAAPVPADRAASRFDRRGHRLGHTNWECAWRTCAGNPQVSGDRSHRPHRSG